MKKRLLSMLIVLSMVLSLVPVVAIPALAAGTTKDAFGISMNTDMTSAESTRANNPYGTDGWFSLFTVNELFLARGHEDGRTFDTYNYNSDGKVGAIASATSGQTVGSKWEGNDDGFTLMDTAPCDPTGSGQDRYAAVLAYWEDQNIMQLYLADQNGNRVSQTVNIGREETLEYLETVDGYNNNGFVSVAAGDFDGDGRDSIVIYMPEMEDWSPYIREYQIGSNLQLGASQEVIGNVFDLTGTGDLSRRNSVNGKVRNNTPLVQLIASDTDNDNLDELVITTSMNNCSADDVSSRESRLFIYDQHPSAEAKWQQTFSKSTKGYGGGMNGAKRLRWASSSVGNIIQNGSGADYPEIVTAGWIDKDDGASSSLTHNIGSYITRCTGASKAADGTPVGSYTSSEAPHFSTDGDDQVSEFTSGGHYTGDDTQSLLPVAVFLAQGVNNKASVLISDTVYQYNNNAFQKVHRGGYFEDDDDGIGSYIITNGAVVDAVVGNFDGNTDGREQVVFATVQKQSSRNNYFVDLYTYQDKANSGWQTDETGYITYHEGDPYVSLSALDVDNDSTIARIKNITKTYTEPEVLALLEATPYYAEVEGGDTGNSETTYGTSKTVTEGTTISNGMTANILAGFEWAVDDACAGFVCGAGVEATVEMGWTWETSNETSVSYELSYANDTGENAVVVYRRPVLAYEYEIKNSEATMVLAKEGTLASSMISVDEYNAAAAQYNLDPIADGVLAEAGNPFSYRNSTLGLPDVVTSEQLTNYKGNGSITQSFTNESSHSKAFTYDMSTSFTAYGMVFGSKFGGGAGTTTSAGKSTINTTAITKSGTVTSKNQEGYDFQWQFTHWTTPVNGNNVPVLGYVLSNVIAPPSPPVNLQAETGTHSATISWEPGTRAADEYRIYQYFDATKKYIQVATVDGTETSCNITDLLPNSTYRYVIRAYSAPGTGIAISGESVDSEQLAFTTAPEGASPITIDSPKDANVRVGGTADFKVGVTLPGSLYQTVTYQWQSRSGTSGWSDMNGETSSALTIANVSQAQSGTLYRCELVALYSGSPIFYYSNAAKLTVGRAAVDATLSVQGYKDGSGTKAVPYAGASDYLHQTGTETKEVATHKNVTVDNAGTTLLVYGTTTAQITDGVVTTTVGAPYYGYDRAGDKYYGLTESGGAYTVGDVLVRTITKSQIGPDGQVLSAVPEFDSDLQMLDTTTKENVIYRLKAAASDPTYRTPLAGTGAFQAVDTRLTGLTGLTYYWQSGSTYYAYGAQGAVGAETQVANADALYDVYAKSATDVVLGRGETWTVKDAAESTETTPVYDNETGYWFNHIAITSTTSGDPPVTTVAYAAAPFLENSTASYTMGGSTVEGFAPAKLSVVTKEETETVTTPVYETAHGAVLTLSATVLEHGTSTPATGTTVDFRVKNTETGAVATLTAPVDKNGGASLTWRAPAAGLYSIVAAVQPDANYAGTESEPKYYDAYGADQTEYRLLLKESASQTVLTGSTPYGSTVVPSLQTRTVANGTPGDWTAYSGGDVIFTVTPANGTETATVAFHPEMAGIYTFRAYKGAKIDPLQQLTSASLEFTRIAVTVTPEWDAGTSPTSAAAVRLTTVPALVDSTDLKNVFDVNCPYFQAAAGAYGRFSVTLSYKAGTDSADAVSAFQNNYVATLTNGDFVIKPSSAQVNFSCGENGKIVGRAGDNLNTMASGSSQITGTQLTFQAIPNGGFAVDAWTVNGQTYPVNEPLPDWLSLSANRETLTIASFDAAAHTQAVAGSETKALTVSATFRNASNVITYGVGNVGGAGASAVSATVSNSGSGEQALASGTSVALGSQVTLTAAPAAGYVVDHWTVDGKTYYRADGVTAYRGTDLTLKDVQEQHTVLVYFLENSGTFAVSTSVCNEDGASDPTLATISASDADTGAAADLNALRNGASVTFAANLAAPINNTVKEWQTSTDGVNFKTVAGSGGQKSITLYNLTAKTFVRAIVTAAQSYTLTYQVKLGDEIVQDADIAALRAVSSAQPLTSGQKQNAYIPVDFALTLNDAYYVVSWSSAAQSSTNPTVASIASLTGDTTVTVAIAKKPVVTITAPQNGTIIVTGTVNGKKDTAVANGGYVDNGSAIAVTLKPEMGYEVRPEDTTDGLVYTDGSGKTTDDKTYTISNVTADRTITHTFDALRSYAVSYHVVDTNNDGTGDFGTLAADVARKGMTAYADVNDRAAALTGSTTVHRDGALTLTAAATAQGYRVKEWKLNGTVYQENGVNFTGNSLDLTAAKLAELAGDPAETVAVSVQFESGDPYITFASPAHGTLSAVSAGAPFSSGGTSKTDVTFTVTPDAHYEVQAWKVDGTAVEGQTKTSFVFTPAGKNAAIAVVLQGEALKITAAAGIGGSVSGLPETVRYNDSVTLTATASKGYAFAGWYLNNQKIDGADAAYTFTAGADGAYEARFTASADNTVAFSVNDGAMGAITATANGQTIQTGIKLSGGQKLVFTAAPKDGYRVKEWTGVDAAAVSADKTTATVDALSGDLTVQAVLEKIPSYTITLAETTHGSITAQVNGKDVTTVLDGTAVTFTALPEQYWMLDAWTDGASGQTGSAITLVVTGDITVGATFKDAVNYTVHYAAVNSENGSVIGTADGTGLTANTAVQVVGGSKLMFRARPKANFMVKAWTLDVGGTAVDVSANLSDELVVNRLDADTTVTVEYEALVEYLLPESTADYTVGNVEKTPAWATEGRIRKGGDVTFTVTPAAGKVITALEATGGTAVRGANGVWTVTVKNTAADIVLKPTVSTGIPLTINSGANGTVTVTRGGVSLSTGDAVLAGDVLTISAAGASGFTLDALTLNGQSFSSGRTYTVLDTDTAITVAATFRTAGGGGGASAVTYAVIVEKSAHGSVSSNVAEAEAGSKVILTAAPDADYALGSLTVLDRSGKAVQITKAGNTITFLMPASSVTVKGVFAKPFQDVKPDDYYFDPVIWAETVDITNGTGDGLFNPGLTCTRAQAVTFLWRAMGSPEPTVTSSPFADVKADAYYYKAVLWATEKGITKGTSTTTFSPEMTVTRAHVTTFLWRTAGTPSAQAFNPFADVKQSAYYRDAVLWAVSESITKGTGSATFSPNGPCTRAQIVTFLYRHLYQ